MKNITQTTGKMVAGGSRVAFDMALQKILDNPSSKRTAAKQLSARIREVNKLAKAARGEARRRYYDLKARMTFWGIKTFKFRVISWETVGPDKIVVVKLADSMVHLPATALPDPKIVNFKRIPFRRTLDISRALMPAMSGMN